MAVKILCETQCNKDCSVQPDADVTIVAGTCPRKDKKKPTCVHKSVSCLLVLKGVIQKTFYTQIVFSSIVAKVSTLAFSGISESFLRPPLRKHRKKFN
jgi:hypothetical protein